MFYFFNQFRHFISLLRQNYQVYGKQTLTAPHFSWVCVHPSRVIVVAEAVAAAVQLPMIAVVVAVAVAVAVAVGCVRCSWSQVGWTPSDLMYVPFHQGSFYECGHAMRDDVIFVTPSLIGWAHAQNNPWIPFPLDVRILGYSLGKCLGNIILHLVNRRGKHLSSIKCRGTRPGTGIQSDFYVKIHVNY